MPLRRTRIENVLRVLTQVQKNYVDDTKVKDLVQGAIRGMLSTLDPHSALHDAQRCTKKCKSRPRESSGASGFRSASRKPRL